MRYLQHSVIEIMLAGVPDLMVKFVQVYDLSHNYLYNMTIVQTFIVSIGQGSNHHSIVLSLSTLIIVVSSIIFLMIILFGFGYVCGNFCQKLHKQPHDRILTNQAMPEQNEECHVDLEMRQNVAYKHVSVPRF